MQILRFAQNDRLSRERSEETWLAAASQSEIPRLARNDRIGSEWNTAGLLSLQNLDFRGDDC
jgi:hypothetical protein